MGKIIYQRLDGTTYDVEEGKTHTPEKGAKVVGSRRDKNGTMDQAIKEAKNLTEFADRMHKVPVGDLINKVTQTTGFKTWWDKIHGGKCLPCVRRRAALNYLRFAGPKWLAEWVKEEHDAAPVSVTDNPRKPESIRK